MKRKLGLAATAVIIALVVVLAINTLRYGLPQHDALPASPFQPDARGAAERLAGALRVPTISREASDGAGLIGEAAFSSLHAHLRASFPGVFAALERLPTDSDSVVLHWPGSDARLLPIVLMAHQDVVPVDPAELAAWSHPPFAGVIADGRIWGRGALDNKGALMAILEAAEALLQDNHQPQRGVYLVFGHDEEIGGLQGAAAVARRFAGQGLRFSWVLDEGGLIVDRPMAGVEVPVALIGVAEKGFLTVNLSGRAPGGHSSKPPRHGAIGDMSAVLLRLQENPMPARIDGATAALFETVASEFGVVQRVLFANQWLFRPVIVRLLERQAGSDALIRTTTALTRFDAGVKSNVLPTSARATVNFRLLPGDTTQSVLTHVGRQIGKAKIEIDTAPFRSEPSRVSSADTDDFRLLAGSILGLDAEQSTVVAPFLTIAATDSRHFEPLADNVYRFNAVKTTIPEVNTIHGVNESIAIDEYVRLIRFYYSVLLNATR